MLSEETRKSFFSCLKSEEKYNRWIELYKEWSAENVVAGNDDAFSVLEFLRSYEDRYAATTLWSVYSILNKYFKVYKNVSLSDCAVLRDWLKLQEGRHLKKKAQVFSREEIDSFLQSESSFHNELIMEKCALVIGLHGLLRVSELTNLSYDDVRGESNGDWVVWVVASKTDKRKAGWTYRVTGDDARHVKNYVDALPEEVRKGRFFNRPLTTRKGFSLQPVGKNTLGSLPRQIARFLKRNDALLFSGHSIRRTGVTILADAGVNRLISKRAGRWKSDTVAEGYIAESLSSKPLSLTHSPSGR